MSYSIPQAFISVRKNRVKTYNQFDNKTRLLYLNDNQEFEIELDNPTNDTYLAQIYLNDKVIDYRGIVLRPGEHVYLDRHLDTPDKFKFSIYTVSKNRESFTESNGLVEIRFFKEQHYFNFGGVTHSGYPCVNTITYPQYRTFYTDAGSTTTMGDTNISFCSSTTTANMNVDPAITETGTVEKGSESQQQLTTVNKDFESVITTTNTYKILPASIKPARKQDLRRYCTNCRTRIKHTWKFCCNCGEHI